MLAKIPEVRLRVGEGELVHVVHNWLWLDNRDNVDACAVSLYVLLGVVLHMFMSRASNMLGYLRSILSIHEARQNIPEIVNRRAMMNTHFSRAVTPSVSFCF